ncbi:NADPH-dependent FMN reductase [Pedobacter boryungensis]|uniref:NAD(P)H-dependent oxidoreductase n=1 Tax=Pedobacter boryungensis TaxID=869962 RepID=A0ABX2DEQ1_9SPHI|nr:NAD(P)H-dependent oxidoreductase [Pedobacter boryungensis]NQX31928.1 NAD(P)H-dependent oxidoreductase [Pedobacter boryungensis]
MIAKNKIFAIIGSTRADSSNLRLVAKIKTLSTAIFDLTIFDGNASLPHFNPDLDHENPPESIVNFRNKIAEADGILICTPEYIFSLPGSLKNAIEWCVSTTVFSHKPVGLITASASGDKAQEELRLIMQTLEARFNDDTTLLIKGVKGKINDQLEIADSEMSANLLKFIHAFHDLINH